MDLATQLVKYFFVDSNNTKQMQSIKTIDGFTKLRPEWDQELDVLEVLRICNQLQSLGYLFEGTSAHPHPILGKSFYAPNFDQRRADYGEYEFSGNGFQRILKDLGPIVLPVVVQTEDEIDDIGTCFFLGNCNTIVTARHVVENKKRVQVIGSQGKAIPIEKIRVHNDPSLDIALMLTSQESDNGKYFRSSEVGILDEIMCLGYPPIPGFQSTLIADISSVNSEIKASKGKVVASEKSYLDAQKYFLINARVKGGNSGGPIINASGYMVGVLVQTSMSATDAESLDSLGYGVATPYSEWKELMGEMYKGVSKTLPISQLAENVFCTNEQ